MFLPSRLQKTATPRLQNEDGPDQLCPVDDARAVIVPEAPDGVRVQESGDEGVLREDPALYEMALGPEEDPRLR